MLGQVVSHYKILEKLGEGGMGIVYRARDLKLDRDVALKFLPPELTRDPEAKQRFITEAKAASALDHSNIYTIHEIDETPEGLLPAGGPVGRQLFIVMAYYDGPTVKQKIERGPLSIDEALGIAIQIAEGIAKAHGSGFIHRDIKPANIIVTRDGTAKILDFGLAKLSGQSAITKSGRMLGTVAYVSPEQALGEEVDHQTDIWSLGAVLYEMLTGQKPFQSEHEQTLIYSIMNLDPKPIRSIRPDVPEVVELITAKALTKDKEERYQKIDEMLSDLKVARGRSDTSETIAATAILKQKRKRTIRTSIIAACSLLLILAGLLIVRPLLQDQAIASNPKTIAFISFENQTGDRSLDNLQSSLPSYLTMSLDESKYFRVMRWDQVRGILRQMGKEEASFIDRELGLELCRRAGIEALGVGTLMKAGSTYVTNLQILDVNSGEPIIKSLRATGEGAESILVSQVDDLAKQITHGLGISRWGTNASLKPIQQITTSSSEAFNFYVRGEYEFDRLHWKDAVRFLELAVKYDSTFAAAWGFLSRARSMASYAANGDPKGIKPARENALRYISRASERERIYIALWDSTLIANFLETPWRGDWLAYWQRCIERFPDDARGHQELGLALMRRLRFNDAIDHFMKAAPTILQSWNLAMYSYLYSNKVDKAIEAARQYAKYGAGEANPIDGLGECFWYAGRFDEAIAEFEKAAEVDPSFAAPERVSIGQLHFLKEEYEEAIASFKRGNDRWWQIYTLIWLGRLKEAEKALPSIENDPDAPWLGAWVAYETGAYDKSRTLLNKWAKRYSPRQQEPIGSMFADYCLGLVDLKQGRSDSVRLRLAEMEQMRIQSGAYTDSVYIPIAYNLYGKALKAAYLYATRRASEIDPSWGGGPGSWPKELERSHGLGSRPIHGFEGPRPLPHAKGFWVPVPFDIVPQAFIQRRMLDSAIVTYEWAVDRKTDFLCPIIPRYHYRLAKLYEQKGMKKKAIEQYTKFLKIWGRADPIFSEPKVARLRLAQLNTQQEREP